MRQLLDLWDRRGEIQRLFIFESDVTTIPSPAGATAEALRAELVRLIREEGSVAISELAAQSGVSRPHLANFMAGKSDLGVERIPEVGAALRELAVRVGDLPTLRALYRASLEQVTESFDLRFLLGADIPKALHNPRLDAYFVEPFLTELHSREGIHLADAMLRHRVLSIFGPAGSGKSTLLAHEALRLIGSESNLPIYFPLNALNPILGDQRRSGGRVIRNLMDAIVLFYESRHGVSMVPLFEYSLGQGKALVMLDGLDEVAPEFVRPVVELINELIESRATPVGNRVIITERGTATYGKGSLIRRATVFHMCPFELGEQRKLVRLWLNLDPDERDSKGERERSLLAALESPRLADLVRNPLFLTLLTVVVITGAPQTLFDEPSRAGLLDTFSRTILGSWNSLRARDRRPTPPHDEFGEYVSQFLLASLAQAMIRPPSIEGGPWEIEDEIDLAEAEIRLLEVYRAEGGDAEKSPLDPDLRDRIRGFLLRAGLLQVLNRRVKFAHQIMRDWFLGCWLSHHPEELERHLSRVIKNPSHEYSRWEQPLAFSLAALVVVRRDHSRANKLAKQALATIPLDMLRLEDALPLGIQVCAHFTMAAPELPLIDEALVPELMRFYEETDYALVTNHLQPMMVAIVDRAPKRNYRPRSISDLQLAIEEQSSAGSTNWVEWVEKVWRYQTDFACLRLLAEETRKRRLSQQDQEKLLRRILFGMNFVTDFGSEAVEFLGEIVREQTYLDSQVRDMASHTLFQQLQRLVDRHPDSPSIPQIKAVLAPIAIGERDLDLHVRPIDIPDLVNQLKTKPIRHVIERSDVFLREFRESTRMSLDECGEALVALIKRLNREVVPTRRDARETATALILLARVYVDHDTPFVIRQQDALSIESTVLEELLAAAEVSPYAQFENVGACQVYDFAVWALRSIFLDTFEVSGLPLPVADLRLN